MDSYLHYTFLIKPKYCLLKATASISSSVYIYIYMSRPLWGLTAYSVGYHMPHNPNEWTLTPSIIFHLSYVDSWALNVQNWVLFQPPWSLTFLKWFQHYSQHHNLHLDGFGTEVMKPWRDSWFYVVSYFSSFMELTLVHNLHQHWSKVTISN